jgi:hypothetical protein
MTRKHYELIAEAISLSTDIGLNHLVNKDQLITALIPAFKRDNPNFDGFKFSDACYKHQTKKAS